MRGEGQKIQHFNQLLDLRASPKIKYTKSPHKIIVLLGNADSMNSTVGGLATAMFAFRERASTTYKFNWQLFRPPSPRFKYPSNEHS